MTKHVTCDLADHDFVKFDDASIYCRKCGEQRVMDLQAAIAALPKTAWLPCPGPHYPNRPYGTGDYWWYSPTVKITSGATSNWASGGIPATSYDVTVKS